MNSNYLKRIIKISTNDNKRAQQILHKMGDNEWSKTLFYGSVLMMILLCTEFILLTNLLPLFSILPLIILYTISKGLSSSIVRYIRYRQYLRDNNMINIFGMCKNNNC